ncbi:MAG TPA: ATPase [Croceicoccus sp.]|nr:ATPase [Croceicoccus sp.]
MRSFLFLATCAAATIASPALADVKPVGADGFVVRHEALVPVAADRAWHGLVQPARWWSGDHTFSGNAANLTLAPQAEGCFCETLPAGAARMRAGSVRHMTVIFADPGKVLRLTGALGPLQGEPVNAVLTVTLSGEGAGTRIVMEYVVGGAMRFSREQIGPAVDGVLREQLARLAALFPVQAPAGDVGSDFLSGVGTRP